MLRAIKVLILVSLYFLYSLFYMLRAKSYDRKGLTERRDAMIAALARRWARNVVKWSGIRVILEGAEHLPEEGSVLFVSNHQSLFDIPMLIGYIPRPMGFIAKKELGKIPILGPWMKYMYCIFMDRQNIRQSLQAINQGAEFLREGHSLVIFPEGHRSRTGELLEFKTGSFKLATKSGVPVIPVAIMGSNAIIGSEGFRIRPGQVRIVLSPPIRSEEFPKKDVNELCGRVRDIIENQVEQHLSKL